MLAVASDNIGFFEAVGQLYMFDNSRWVEDWENRDPDDSFPHNDYFTLLNTEVGKQELARRIEEQWDELAAWIARRERDKEGKG